MQLDVVADGMIVGAVDKLVDVVDGVASGSSVEVSFTRQTTTASTAAATTSAAAETATTAKLPLSSERLQMIIVIRKERTVTRQDEALPILGFRL